MSSKYEKKTMWVKIIRSDPGLGRSNPDKVFFFLRVNFRSGCSQPGSVVLLSRLRGRKMQFDVHKNIFLAELKTEF